MPGTPATALKKRRILSSEEKSACVCVHSALEDDDESQSQGSHPSPGPNPQPGLWAGDSGEKFCVPGGPTQCAEQKTTSRGVAAEQSKRSALPALCYGFFSRAGPSQRTFVLPLPPLGPLRPLAGRQLGGGAGPVPPACTFSRTQGAIGRPNICAAEDPVKCVADEVAELHALYQAARAEGFVVDAQ